MNWLVEKAYADYKFDWLKPKIVQGGAGDVQGLINTVITWICMIAAALAIIYLIYSGIIYITAAGNPDAAKKGQQGVINAIIGIVIIVLAYFIATAITRFAGGAAT